MLFFFDQLLDCKNDQNLTILTVSNISLEQVMDCCINLATTNVTKTLQKVKVRENQQGKKHDALDKAYDS